MWNIGAEGQFVAGAMAATAITVYFPHLPMYLSIPVYDGRGHRGRRILGIADGDTDGPIFKLTN